MIARAFLLVIVGCLASGGCRSPSTAVEFELLHRELREMEDLVFELDYKLKEKEDELELVRQHQKLSDDTGDVFSGDGEFEPPSIDLGASADLSDSTGADIPDPPDGYLDSPTSPLQPPRESDSTSRISLDPHVTHIYLNPLLTGGRDLDGSPGDDGLRLVVEPRNADGVYVPLAGNVAVVALDPEIEGPLARVGRWDFDAGETSQLMRSASTGRGIHLELPWVDDPPEHRRVHLFVRYETADGRKLHSDRQVTIAAPGEESARWTPSARFTQELARQAPAPPKLADNGFSVREFSVQDYSVQDLSARSAADSPSRSAVESPRLAPGSSVLVPPPSQPGSAPMSVPHASNEVRQAQQKPVWSPNRQR